MVKYIDIYIEEQLAGNIIKEVEARIINQTLEQCKYNQTRAAKALGISRGGLRIKLEKYFPGEYIEKREGD